MNVPGQRVAVLSHLRCGGNGVRRLLAPFVSAPDLGESPFGADGLRGRIYADLNPSDDVAMRAALAADLASGPLFSHILDRHPARLNAALLATLEQQGYRVVYVERKPRVERIASAMLANLLELPDQAAVATLRERLKRGLTLPEFSAEQMDAAILCDGQSRDWLAQRWSRSGLLRVNVEFSEVFRSGIAALGTFDRLVSELGLGSRSARLNDSSLLAALACGACHTLSLQQYSAAVRSLIRGIEDRVSKVGSLEGLAC